MIFGLTKKSIVHLIILSLKKDYSADDILEDILLNMRASDLVKLIQRKGITI